MIRRPAVLQSRWWRAVVEAAIVCVLMVGSYRLAYRFLEVAGARTFIDWELKPAVMFSCGYGFTQPAAPSSAIDAFIARERASIGCRDFAWGGAPTEAIGIAFAHRYSLYGAGWAMRSRGVSWKTLDEYLAWLFAVSMAFTYGLFRTAAGRVLSVLGVVAIACSMTLTEIVTVRDFVKLPCFTALWLMLAWVVRRGLGAGARATLLPMALAGALIGLAIGFRMDTLVFLPAFLAIAIVVVPGFSRGDVLRKAAAAVLCVVMFLVVGRPILSSLAAGSNSAHVVLLGLMTAFDRALSIQAAPYDIGSQYSDGYAYTVAVSHGLLKQGERLPVLLGSPQYDQIGGRLLRELAANFPSDFMVRAIGATAQVFRFPFDWRIHALTGKQPTFQESPLLRGIGEWRGRVLGVVAERELATTLFVLILASAFNWRLGALGFAAILYFCGYSMLQFSRRHAFHLDVIPIFVVVLAIQLPLTIASQVRRRWRHNREDGRRRLHDYVRHAAIGTAVLAGAIALLVMTIAGARWWQQRHVRAVVSETLDANWESVPVRDEPLAPLILINGSPVPTWTEIYGAEPELWKTAMLLRVAGIVPAGTEAVSGPDLLHQYFKVSADNRCRQDEVLIALKYDGQSPNFYYTRVFKLTVASAPAYLLTPAYYHLGPSWNRFDGFAVPIEHRSCITAVARAVEPRSLPLPVVAFALAPDWTNRPLYQQLPWRPRYTMFGTAVDPLATDEEVHNSGWRRYNDAPLANLAPPLDQWSASEGVVVTLRDDGNFHVAGNTLQSGYQLVSPPLDVVPGQLVAVQIAGRVVAGEMCVGILSNRWLLPPTDARIGLVANTGESKQVRVVFSNCAYPPGEFTVRAVSFQSFPKP